MYFFTHYIEKMELIVQLRTYRPSFDIFKKVLHCFSGFFTARNLKRSVKKNYKTLSQAKMFSSE